METEKVTTEKEYNEQFIKDHIQFETDNGYDHNGSRWLKKLWGFTEKHHEFKIGYTFPPCPYAQNFDFTSCKDYVFGDHYINFHKDVCSSFLRKHCLLSLRGHEDTLEARAARLQFMVDSGSITGKRILAAMQKEPEKYQDILSLMAIEEEG